MILPSSRTERHVVINDGSVLDFPLCVLYHCCYYIFIQVHNVFQSSLSPRYSLYPPFKLLLIPFLFSVRPSSFREWMLWVQSCADVVQLLGVHDIFCPEVSSPHLSHVLPPAIIFFLLLLPRYSLSLAGGDFS